MQRQNLMSLQRQMELLYLEKKERSMTTEVSHLSMGITKAVGFLLPLF